MFLKSVKTDQVTLGPYSPAVKLGDFVYVSGQLGLNANGELEDSIEAQTKASIENLKNILSKLNLELRHVVKTTVYMSDLNDFQKFNEIYASYFSEPYPARSCVQVAALPKNAKVEIEAFVIDTLVYEQQMANSCDNCQESSGGCQGCK